MKRRTLVLTVIAGLLVFLAVLVLYLPASWFAAALPPQVRCAELGGSVWHGECLGLEVSGAKMGDATWNLAAGAAILGKLRGDLEVHGAQLTASADVDLTFNGAGELRNVNAIFPLDPAFVAQFPRDQRGTIVADLNRVVLEANAVPRQLEGTIELRDLRQLSPQPLLFGSYQVTFAGGAQPDAPVVGQLRDLGGIFAIEGTLTLTPPNTYVMQGFITGRSADAERMVREITLGARPDAAGRSSFSFESSY